MKIIQPLLLGFILLFVISCDKDDEVEKEYVNVAKPLLMSKQEFRNSVQVQSAKSIDEPGKIYAYNNLILVGDQSSGIHIIDNSNPINPVAKGFIKIHGNSDFSVKNDFLYADSAIDLLVFDISDVNDVKFANRLEDVFYSYTNIPEDVFFTDYSGFNYEEDVIIGWDVVLEPREEIEPLLAVFDATTSALESVGQSGSLARFQIGSNYLYTVDDYEMRVFNISNLSQPTLENQQYAGWRVETMFLAEDYMYLGSTNGMYIYSLSNPSLPEYVAEITHWEGCDPVVVDGDYAYLTLRGGNTCGQQESELQVIDVSDKANPNLIKVYALENPYGLGYKNNNLFVCDGTSGFKIFDKSNPLDITLKDHFSNIEATDVIPLNNSLLMIGGGTLYQYAYSANSLNLLSVYNL